LGMERGLERRERFDPCAGVTRLVTERASLSAATQRAGRAARQQAGIAYRLWEEAGNGGLPPFDPPEILESDLAPVLLDCARWGENDPAKLRWLDQPPNAALEQARKLLVSIDALDAQGHITPHGAMIAALPLPPHLAHMVVVAGESGQADEAARGRGESAETEPEAERRRAHGARRTPAAEPLGGGLGEDRSRRGRNRRPRRPGARRNEGRGPGQPICRAQPLRRRRPSRPALPWGTPSTTSNSTISPSSLIPARWARVPPIWPAPTSAIRLRAMKIPFRLTARSSSRGLTSTRGLVKCNRARAQGASRAWTQSAPIG